MFRCAEGHITDANRPMVPLPTAVREVVYEHSVRDPTRQGRPPTLVSTTRGTEIVETAFFCPSCATNTRPPTTVVNPGSPVTRVQVVSRPQRPARRSATTE